MRFEYRAARPIAALSILVLLAACSRTQQDWRVAQQAGTARAYEIFVARHPDSELASVARERAAQLTEQAAWQQATRANTAAAYQEYLAKYPNGSWSQDARIRMESKSLPATPAQDPAAAVPASADHPVSAPGWPRAAVSAAGQQTSSAAARPGSADTAAASAPAPDAAAGRSAVQLGAFSTPANAHSAWNQLSSRFRSELQGMTPQIVPVMSSGRRLYRLEARVGDPAAARRLCRQLQQHSQGCLPLP
ncbi:MAG TPA: SPOR domain-containing protein [Steroidobacteraceae bacterium]|nr:SPOR domain-containing protein [Steroidobacteraceae bacterium]